jgi:hypothetical protein
MIVACGSPRRLESSCLIDQQNGVQLFADQFGQTSDEFAIVVDAWLSLIVKPRVQASLWRITLATNRDDLARADSARAAKTQGGRSSANAAALSQQEARAVTGAGLNIENGNWRGSRHAVRARHARI